MRRLLLVAFSMLMIAGSAIHTLWAAQGLALKYCYGQPGPCSDVIASTSSYWNLAYGLGAVPGFIAAFVLLALVLAGRTWYPRWTAIVDPGLLALVEPLARAVPAPLGAVLVGGATNLSIALFFLVSTCTTWADRPQVSR